MFRVETWKKLSLLLVFANFILRPQFLSLKHFTITFYFRECELCLASVKKIPFFFPCVFNNIVLTVSASFLVK